MCAADGLASEKGREGAGANAASRANAADIGTTAAVKDAETRMARDAFEEDADGHEDDGTRPPAERAAALEVSSLPEFPRRDVVAALLGAARATVDAAKRWTDRELAREGGDEAGGFGEGVEEEGEMRIEDGEMRMEEGGGGTRGSETARLSKRCSTISTRTSPGSRRARRPPPAAASLARFRWRGRPSPCTSPCTASPPSSCAPRPSPSGGGPEGMKRAGGVRKRNPGRKRRRRRRLRGRPPRFRVSSGTPRFPPRSRRSRNTPRARTLGRIRSTRASGCVTATRFGAWRWCTGAGSGPGSAATPTSRRSSSRSARPPTRAPSRGGSSSSAGARA